MRLTNPTTHYKAIDNGVLPNNPNTWIPYSSTITKTIYDPCPYGYSVPINESWTGFPKNTWTRYTVYEGQSWPAEDGGWWPAAGERTNSTAVLYSIGHGAYYWSSSRPTSNVNHLAYHLYFYYNDDVYPSNTNYRSRGFSVRCIEREENKQSKL